jgi:hypothetical protein
MIMTKHASAARLAGFGAVALGLTLAGCGGTATPFGGSPAPSIAGGQSVNPTAIVANQGDVDLSGAQSDNFRHRHHHHGYCAAVSLSQHFNGQEIPKGTWLLFTSVVQFPGNHGSLRVEMRDSKIYLYDGYHSHAIKGPDMVETIGPDQVRLRFNSKGGGKLFHGMPGGWDMKAPSNTGGNNFLDDIVYRVPHTIPGNLQNVTWSAKFYSKSDIQQMHWQWGAAEYSHLSTNYGRLMVKPLDDNHYPPYNNDPAGTPERFKAWYDQQGGGTGGQHYTGIGGPNANVTPCY